jgi:hypothetical protein
MVERETLWVAMAVAPEFRPHARVESKWIVLWNRAVGANANDRPGVIGEILRAPSLLPIAEREKEVAVQGDSYATSQELRPCCRGSALEDHLWVRNGAISEIEMYPCYAHD